MGIGVVDSIIVVLIIEIQLWSEQQVALMKDTLLASYDSSTVTRARPVNAY